MVNILMLASLFMFFCYEFVIFLKTKGFIRLTMARNVDEMTDKDASNKLALLIVNIYYIAFTLAGVAFAHQWQLFGALFLVGVVSSIVVYYNKSSEELIKKIDSVICMVLLAMIFMNHYH